jgi:hypothetical protein
MASDDGDYLWHMYKFKKCCGTIGLMARRYSDSGRPGLMPLRCDLPVLLSVIKEALRHYK